MSKKTKEKEAKIIAEMEEALKEQGLSIPKYTGGDKKKRHVNGYDETMPQKIHCSRCKTLMENGVCPSCGHTVYVPMEKEKRDKFRLIATIVCMAVFVVAFLVIQIKKG